MAGRNLKSIHGRALAIDSDGKVTAKDGFVSGGGGKASYYHPGPEMVSSFEDFTDLLNVKTRISEVDTGAGHSASLHSKSKNGVFVFYNFKGTAVTSPVEGEAVSGYLHVEIPKPGMVHFGCRVRLSSVTRSSKRCHVFAGFTDTGDYEMPAYDTGAGVITQAADCMGFMFSPGGDTGWSAVSAKSTAGDSGDQLVGGLGTPTASNYTNLEFTLRRAVGDTGGTATFYIDGLPVAVIDSPIATNKTFCPTVQVFQQDTGGQQVIVDWMHWANTRDTGSN